MRVPYKFIVQKNEGWSLCIACEKWRKTRTFRHEGRLWTLCVGCTIDYWDATDELLPDYKGPRR